MTKSDLSNLSFLLFSVISMNKHVSRQWVDQYEWKQDKIINMDDWTMMEKSKSNKLNGIKPNKINGAVKGSKVHASQSGLHDPYNLYCGLKMLAYVSIIQGTAFCSGWSTCPTPFLPKPKYLGFLLPWYSFPLFLGPFTSRLFHFKRPLPSPPRGLLSR